MPTMEYPFPPFLSSRPHTHLLIPLDSRHRVTRDHPTSPPSAKTNACETKSET